MYALGATIFLELAGGVLFVLGSRLGAFLLVRSFFSAVYCSACVVCAACGAAGADGLCAGTCDPKMWGSICRGIGIACCGIHPKSHPEHLLYAPQILFLVAVTPVMHNFWDLKDGSEEQVSSICMPLSQSECLPTDSGNVAVMGAALTREVVVFADRRHGAIFQEPRLVWRAPNVRQLEADEDQAGVIVARICWETANRDTCD